MRNIISRIILVTAGMMLPAIAAQAAIIEIQNVQIESIRAGTGPTLVIKLPDSTPLSTGCTVTDQAKTFYRSTVTDAIDMMKDLALYADAQGRSVDIFYDNAVCNATYGRSLDAIRVRPPQ